VPCFHYIVSLGAVFVLCSRTAYVGFVVDEVAFVWVDLQELRFSLLIIPPMLHTPFITMLYNVSN